MKNLAGELGVCDRVWGKGSIIVKGAQMRSHAPLEIPMELVGVVSKMSLKERTTLDVNCWWCPKSATIPIKVASCRDEHHMCPRCESAGINC